MATNAEIEVAVNAMRAIPTRGGTVHDDVLRAYARAALAAAVLVQVKEYRRRAELLADAATQEGVTPSSDTGSPAALLL